MMGSTLTRAITALGAILVLVAVNHSIRAKERIISTGEPIYLALAPVDPRSLMQGDYMALRFQLADQLSAEYTANISNLRAPIVLDARQVATLAGQGIPTDLFIRYRLRDGGAWLGTNAYFFEEGAAARFTNARFGEFRLDRDSGEAVLVGLRDAELKAL
ncbi:GDYXXLXY domain-containing protein [Peristeroidobacter agariperforans]|uniref:GDYXXLXY domain-containing protein n=1 Tax=Peristeroidobacter agariperforans TaxID=268404 RepID=UPI00101CCB2B|nr:GDYXXLXY domain-containing protein [Peristeroidobacter agariperforans]